MITDGLPAVEAACAEALGHGVHSADIVLNVLARRRDPVAPITILTPEVLKPEPAADCARYNTYGGWLMERTEILDFMSELKLFTMKAAFGEVSPNASRAATNRRASSTICSRRTAELRFHLSRLLLRPKVTGSKVMIVFVRFSLFTAH